MPQIKHRAKEQSKGDTPGTILFRGRKYWHGGNAFTLRGAKKLARKWMKAGYKIRIIDRKYDPLLGVYVRPNPDRPVKIG